MNTPKNDPSGWPAFSGEWARDGKGGFNQGIDRDTYIFTAVLSGLMGNPLVKGVAADKTVEHARKITDLAHKSLARAFRGRVERVSEGSDSREGPF